MGLANRLTEPGEALDGRRSRSPTSSPRSRRRACAWTGCRPTSSGSSRSTRRWTTSSSAAGSRCAPPTRPSVASWPAKVATEPDPGPPRPRRPPAPLGAPVNSWRTSASVEGTSMAAADTAKTRTVGDIMSTPVIVASPDDKVAEAAARMREQRVGSVVVVDGSRPSGILTERDLVRIAAAGADTGAATVRDWMTANPDSVAPDVDAADRVRQPLRSTGTATSRSSTTTRSSASSRCATSCASRRSSRPRTSPTRSPAGLEGVVVAETDDRRRARARRLLPLPPVQRGRARGEALARRRLVPHVRGRAADAPPKPRRSARGSRRCARSRPRSSAHLPDIARLGRNAPPLDMLRTTVSLLGAQPRLPAVARHRRRRAAEPGAAGVRGRPDAAHRDLPAATRPRADRSRPRRSRTRRTTCTC